MKLLLDEQITPEVAVQLGRRGHDVTTARDADLEQTPDAEIMAAATRARRAVVTRNHRDFRPIHAMYIATGRSHYGLILIPRHAWLSNSGMGQIINALDSLLRTHTRDDALDTTEVWLSAD